VGESTAELKLHVASASGFFCRYLEPARPFKGPPFEACQVLAAEHYSALAAKIAELEKRATVLGRTPRCDPLEQVNIAHLSHEPERFILEATLRLGFQPVVMRAKGLRESREAARKRSDPPSTWCPGR